MANEAGTTACANLFMPSNHHQDSGFFSYHGIWAPGVRLFRKLTPEFMSYTIAKMGLWAFTQTAARALAPDVRVNAIGPGSTLKGEHQSPEQFERQRAASVLERGANAEDIIAALGYFLDAPAVTGQLLCVDGGQHLGWKTPDILGPSG